MGSEPPRKRPGAWQRLGSLEKLIAVAIAAIGLWGIVLIGDGLLLKTKALTSAPPSQRSALLMARDEANVMRPALHPHDQNTH